MIPPLEPSEQAFHPQIVCVWVTGVNIARWFDPSVPGTQAEVKALAAAGGMPPSGELPNGSHGNYSMLKVAMQKQYGLVGELHESFNPAAAQAAVLAAAAEGPCAAALAGDQYSLLPHWQNGHVGHSIAAIYESGLVGVQLDPLAPAHYPGDPFPPAELAKFATAALIFKQEATMPGFKAAGPAIGTFVMPAGGHALISPSDTIHGRYPQPNGGTWSVFALLDLKTAAGVAIDIDGHSPPQNHRDQVCLVDAPAFGAGAYALRSDGSFTPAPAGHTDQELAKAASNAATSVASAAVTAAKQYP